MDIDNMFKLHTITNRNRNGEVHSYNDDEKVAWIHPKYLTEERLYNTIRSLSYSEVWSSVQAKNLIVLNEANFSKVSRLISNQDTTKTHILGFEIRIDSSVNLIYVM